MLIRVRFAAALAALCLLTACATREPAAPAAAFAQAEPAAALAGQAEYRVGPSDLLAVKVFQVEDLDREVRVNNAGEISLPLIGVLPAAGRTVNELEAEIARLYGERYLRSPQVSVFVEEFASQRVTVGGAVKKPGIFPMTTSRLTLLQAVALAEGVQETASVRNVLVFREQGGTRSFARFDMKAIQNGELADPELMGEDVVVVDTSTGKVALQNLIKLTPLLAVWRVYR